MGHPDRKCPVCVFRHPWRRCWACEFIFPREEFLLKYCFSGIPSGERNLCRHWRSPPGLCPSRFPCATYFDTHCSQAAKDASASREKLNELFNRIERFFRRLEIYTGVTPTTAMTDMIIEIMVEVLNILAIATKEVKRGRLSELMSCRFNIFD
jgi:hypothetical protein